MLTKEPDISFSCKYCIPAGALASKLARSAASYSAANLDKVKCVLINVVITDVEVDFNLPYLSDSKFHFAPGFPHLVT